MRTLSNPLPATSGGIERICLQEIRPTSLNAVGLSSRATYPAVCCPNWTTVEVFRQNSAFLGDWDDTLTQSHFPLRGLLPSLRSVSEIVDKLDCWPLL
jgi:hypothetical protein